jgi:hypothetical protein
MKIILLSGFISVFIFCSCNKKKSDIHISGYFPMNKIVNLDSLNRPMDSTALYFPSYEFETLEDDNRAKSRALMFTKLASYYLYDLKEPILSSKYLGKRMYRLFYVGQTDPKSIRLIKEDDRVDIVIKYGVFPDPYGPVKLDKEVNFSIKKEYWDTLSTLAKKTRMWNVPPIVDHTDFFGFLIEGHSEYGYTQVGRARIVEDVNAKETRELRKFFDRVEKLR